MHLQLFVVVVVVVVADADAVVVVVVVVFFWRKLRFYYQNKLNNIQNVRFLTVLTQCKLNDP